MKYKCIIHILVLLSTLISGTVNAQYNVKDFGAKGDGLSLDTKFIQSAIDKAFETGGGVVTISNGTYLIGTLILKDNVNLNIQSGAELLGSPDYRDYTEILQKFESRTKDLYAKYFMIFAEGAKDISITGTGKINGNGLNNFLEIRPANLRPVMIRLVDCENVIVRDIQMLESANWTFHLLACREVSVEGIVIKNQERANRDGLDIDCCQGVRVSNSRFSTGDDAIVLKSTSDLICRDIAISNCVLSTNASAIKTGTESNGGFKNITVSNCIIKDVPHHAGIELMTVDGGILQNILIENIVMENVATPIFVRVGIRTRPYKAGQYVTRIGDVRDIFLNNITVVEARYCSSIMGLHNRKIKNINITNYTVRNSETEAPDPYNMIPFEEFSYPMSVMFPNLPAYGLYCRNVEELHLQNVSMYLSNQEVRPALVFDRASQIELFAVRAQVSGINTPMVYFRNSDHISTSFCRSIGESGALFGVEEGTVDYLNLSNSVLHPGQMELLKAPPMPEAGFFEDFKSAMKYSVDKGEMNHGLKSHPLKHSPLHVNMAITERGSLQLCLLIRNEADKPGSVMIKYQGITQEFYIDWNEWGWAPLTMLKEYESDQEVDFEIISVDPWADLKVAKVYIRSQNIKWTD